MKILIKTGMISVFIFLSINIGQFALADEYTRSHEFKPIHIERNELLKTATEIFLYIKKINGDSIATNGSIMLGIDNNSTTIDFPLEQNAYEKFPRTSYECNLRIRSYKGGVISELTLRLNDRNRILTVTGTNHEDVTGVIKVVQEKLEFHESNYGGYGYRFLLYIILLIILMVVTYPGWYGIKVMNRYFFACLVIFLITLSLIVFIPSWAKIFPGFIARIENSSFLEKNSPLFTFLGFLLALLIPLGAFILRRKKNNITPEKEADT